MNELKIDNKKIKSIKVTNGTIYCVGDIFQITGDFEIEFKDCECKCKETENKQEVETIECTEDEFLKVQKEYIYYPKEINIHVIGQGTYKNCKIYGSEKENYVDMKYSDFIEESEEK